MNNGRNCPKTIGGKRRISNPPVKGSSPFGCNGVSFTPADSKTLLVPDSIFDLPILNADKTDSIPPKTDKPGLGIGLGRHRTCLCCGKVFSFTRDNNHGRPRQFCSKGCGLDYYRKHPTFHTPTSEPSARIRANGLINERIKRGAVVRPDHCNACHLVCKPDAHHDDYSKPGEVRWLCRSCHMTWHARPQTPVFLAESI